MGDVMDGQATHARNTQRLLELMRQQLDHMDQRLSRMEANQASITRELRVVASKQILMANCVEEVVGRAFHSSRRLDELEHSVPETP